MKTFWKSLRRQEGFTLVELMVVVAIIGLLSAVAIPNFKKYQAKSKTSEAKLHLSAMYTAQQAFFSDYNIYHVCLRYMGYDPSGEAAQRFYLTGFPNTTPAIDASAFSSAVNSGLNDAAYVGGTSTTINGVTLLQTGSGGCPNSSAALDSNGFFLPAKKIGTQIAAVGHVGTGDAALTVTSSAVTSTLVAGIGVQALDATMAFRAVAVGVIDSDNIATTNSSIWAINQDKMIQNPRTGY